MVPTYTFLHIIKFKLKCNYMLSFNREIVPEKGAKKMIHLRVENVSTFMDRKKLIKDISFLIPAGKIFALVGHNGAGKSTLMKTILKVFMKEEEGKIVIQEKFDQDEHFLEFKKHLSYLPEEPMLLNELTVMQHFQMYGISYGIAEKEFQEKVDRFVNGFELVEKLHVYPEELSKGMRQKVQTICAFLPNVPVLLIDEPFMGLDIYAVQFVIQLMQEKVQHGTSILLTTHQLDQVIHLADEFILLKQGEMIETGPIEQFDTISRGSDDV